MKKFVLLLVLAFTMSPLLNAAESSRTCHEMAQAVANDSGTEGAEYTSTYMETYNWCEGLDDEEVIADGF